MAQFERYAVYYAPEPGALADFGAAWLGWDAARGQDAAHPRIPDLPQTVAQLTETPRKYGFHGTLKPPFRLVDGATQARLEVAVADLAQTLAPAHMPGLALEQIGGFVALIPTGDTAGLERIASACVKELDPFRAPLSAEDLIRRNAARLSEAQKELLGRWGYPFVMEEFRFHLTLTGNLPPEAAAAVRAALAPQLAPLIARPFVIRDICLFGEARDGRFHILHRYALSGSA